LAELLRIDGLDSGYGAGLVLQGISCSLEEGESLALLGRNGMGKSTLLATLMGATTVRAGRIAFRGRDLVPVPPHRRAGLGLGWVPQEREIFGSLTVAENLTAAARPGPWTVERVYATFGRLHERRANLGHQLSGGEQQMLSIARALMLNPQLLLLDEPLEGLAPLIVAELLALIRGLTEHGGIAMILVEQHARQVLPLTRRALVLERGRVVHDGPSQALRDDPSRLERWLGVGAHGSPDSRT